VCGIVLFQRFLDPRTPSSAREAHSSPRRYVRRSWRPSHGSNGCRSIPEFRHSTDYDRVECHSGRQGKRGGRARWDLYCRLASGMKLTDHVWTVDELLCQQHQNPQYRTPQYRFGLLIPSHGGSSRRTMAAAMTKLTARNRVALCEGMSNEPVLRESGTAGFWCAGTKVRPPSKHGLLTSFRKQVGKYKSIALDHLSWPGAPSDTQHGRIGRVSEFRNRPATV